MTSKHDRWSGFPSELTLDDRPGPANYLHEGKADAMIESALSAAGLGLAAALPKQAAVKQAPRTQRARLLQLAAAGVLAFVSIGTASAAVMWFVKRKAEPAQELRLKPALEEPAPVIAPVIPAEVKEEPQRAEIDEGEVKHRNDDRTRTRKPEDWLEEANRLRAQKRWKDADEVYARVWQTAPHSDAAYVARVASAGVRLEQLHDPRTALARYKNALKASPSGSLSEEARYGIAEAYRAMGDSKAERAALESFIARHPNAGLTIRAKTRMMELESSP